MASYSHSSELIPAELREPVADFLNSGLHQIERVCKGPRARSKVSDGIGYRTKSKTHGTASTEATPTLTAMAKLDAKLREFDKSGASCKQPAFQTMRLTLHRVPERPGTQFRLGNNQTEMMAQALAAPTSLVIANAEAAQLPLKLLSDTVRHVFAGTAARTMSQAFIHPIDTIKTRMQVNKVTAPPLLQNWRRCSKEKTLNVFIGKHRVLKLRHWLVQGPLDLYRGLTCAIIGTIPVAMIYFSTYEGCKGFMEKRGASTTCSHLASASMGAVMSAFVRVPTDTLRHQTQAYLIPNFIQGARSIVKKEGIAGLYHGLVPTLLRDVPELTLQFSLYESLRHALQSHGQEKKLQTWQHLMLGGISGAVAATATCPLDVTKTAMQCGNGHSAHQILGSIVREKGLPGLFAGMGPRVAQIALQGAVFFTLFEAWKAQLKPVPMRLGDDRFICPKLWQKRRGHVWKRQFVFQ